MRAGPGTRVRCLVGFGIQAQGRLGTIRERQEDGRFVIDLDAVPKRPDGSREALPAERVVADAECRDIEILPEKINHPAHYGGDTPFEAIKVIESWRLGFQLGNALKYILRAGKKGSAAEDRQKALWYLRRAKEHRSRGGHIYVQAYGDHHAWPLHIDSVIAAHALSVAHRPVLYGIQFGDIDDAIAAFDAVDDNDQP